jgi:hypothetical protein
LKEYLPELTSAAELIGKISCQSMWTSDVLKSKEIHNNNVNYPDHHHHHHRFKVFFLFRLAHW